MTTHGTLSCGKYRKCKRPECVEAVRAYRRLRYRKQGYGQWQPLVDATPARQHIEALHNLGYSYRSIAASIGKYTAAITKIAYPSPTRKAHHRIRPELEAAILAIKPEDIVTGMVPAAGTSRRLRALNAIGWPNTVIGERVGSWNTQLLHTHQQKYVLQTTAAAVAECFEQLKDLDPVEHGVPVSLVKTLTARAAQKNWRDPLWWEDMGHIDDPDFDPAAVEQELGRNEEAAVRRAEIKHLMSYGFDHEVIAARMDMHPTTVRNIMNELRRGQRRDRSRGVAA